MIQERTHLCCKCVGAWIGEPASSCPFCRGNAILVERNNLARALFRIRSLTMRGRGDEQLAKIACDAVMHIDETPLFPTERGQENALNVKGAEPERGES